MKRGDYLCVEGRTGPVVALTKQNGVIECAVVKLDGKPILVPLALAVEAPGRSVPRLVTVDGERV